MSPFEFFANFMNLIISGLSSITFYGISIITFFMAVLTAFILVDVIRRITK